MAVVSQVVAARDLQSSVLASGRHKLTQAQVQEWYARQKSSGAERRSDDPILPDLHPSSGGEGYLSSEHSQGELMPEQLDAIAIREAKRRRERKALWESLEIIERMRQKSQRGR